MKRLIAFALLFMICVPFLQAQSILSKSIKGLDASGDEFVFVNLTSGEIIPKVGAAFGGWDVAFQGTNIQVNGQAQFLDSTFDALTEAPQDGFLSEESGPVTMPSSGEERWFNYDPTTHIISPVANRLLVIKTKAGHYAKLEILDYYKATFGEDSPTPRFYSFKYVLQTSKEASFN